VLRRFLPALLAASSLAAAPAAAGAAGPLPSSSIVAKLNAERKATVVLATGDETAPEKQRQITHSWTFKTTRKALGYVAPARRRH
jgi:hypothetical protein